MNSIIRTKILWAEIKAHEQEYKRLLDQIDKIQENKRNLSFLIQKKLVEVDKIGMESEIENYQLGNTNLMT
jgi:hypothetical protein